MAERQPCEFHLIRYVPDAVKNEFVNIGVVLRSAPSPSRQPIENQLEVRFTRDWSRVRCIDPDADIEMLEALEIEVGRRLAQHGSEAEEKPVMALLADSLSNAVQMTEPKAFLAETFISGLEQLIRLYIEAPKRERSSRRSGRQAILASMRANFESAGVWALMRKQIAASSYTRPGDLLRIDCGYRPNGVVRMFQAVSLESDAEAAKVLAFSVAALKQGIQRVEKASLELTAVIEPIRDMGKNGKSGKASPSRKGSSAGARAEEDTSSISGSGNGAGLGNDSGDELRLDEDRIAQYRFAVETMEEHEIRVMTTSDLPRMAEAARRELRV